jgi:excisionase family DNA binding protein
MLTRDREPCAMSRFFSSTDVAALIGVDASSINRWIDAGRLRAHRTPGGHRRIQQQDLLDFLSQFGMPVPAELADLRGLLLVLDPDPDARRALKRTLNRTDPSIEVTTAASALEAMLLVGAQHPDGLYFSLGLKDCDPLQICQTLLRHEDYRGVKLVGLQVGSDNESLRQQLLSAGVAVVLTRPFKGSDLLAPIYGAH